MNYRSLYAVFLCDYFYWIFTCETWINKINIQDRKDKRKAKKELVKQIKTGISERNQKEKQLICPSCGGNLILRKGKYGKFYGCSNYPKCRYSKEK